MVSSVLVTCEAFLELTINNHVQSEIEKDDDDIDNVIDE